jgi:rhodanese-related sulfurtransferase
VEQFLELWKANKNGVLIDVRTASEFKEGTLPKALNFDVMSPSFGQKIQGLSKEQACFVFCRSGSRSRAASVKLRAQGFQVFELQGGWMNWQRSGLKWAR